MLFVSCQIFFILFQGVEFKLQEWHKTSFLHFIIKMWERKFENSDQLGSFWQVLCKRMTSVTLQLSALEVLPRTICLMMHFFLVLRVIPHLSLIRWSWESYLSFFFPFCSSNKPTLYMWATQSICKFFAILGFEVCLIPL